MRITIEVSDELFRFESMEDWINNAQLRFRNSGHTGQSTICIDQAGQVCPRGKQFRSAAYPVAVYAIDDPPYQPAGMLRDRQKKPEEEDAAQPAPKATEDRREKMK